MDYQNTNSACVPAPVEDVHGDGRWFSMHNRFIHCTKEKEPEVLLVGDSIIERLIYTDIWECFMVPLHSINFGIGGDQTQNILWRLQNGELDNIEPKVVVLCVGTNNHENSASEIVEGILEITRLIIRKQPQAQVIVMGIPPRGENPNKLREKIEQINKELQEQVPDITQALYFHVDPSLFVNAQDGKISPTDMHDYLHFTRQGYHKLMEPLVEDIENLLKNFMTADAASACSHGSAGD